MSEIDNNEDDRGYAEKLTNKDLTYTIWVGIWLIFLTFLLHFFLKVSPHRQKTKTKTQAPKTALNTINSNSLSPTSVQNPRNTHSDSF